jgi:repressor LexA
MPTLTPRQAEILAMLRTFTERHHRPPTRAELAEHFGFRSPNAAEEHLRTLARKGAIELIPGAARGIRLKTAGLPIIGRVAAGNPILAEEHIEAYVRFEAGWFRPRADYLLRVKGMSMRDVGILDGDLLAVHRTSTAESGQIVVARLEDEVTVKRLQRRGSRVRLLPANPDFKPIDIDPRRDIFAIEGIGVGVLRNGLLRR